MHLLDKNNNIDPSGLWVSLPMAIAFYDSHEIKSMAELLTTLGDKGSKVKWEEIGFRDGQYIGLFYFSKSDPAYKRLKEEYSGDDSE